MDIYGDQIQGDRPEQEDSYRHTQIAGGSLALVADGLGGHAGGEIASAQAAAEFIDFLHETEDELTSDPQYVLQAAIRAAHAKLVDIGEKQPELRGLGTTLSALLFASGRLYKASVGDSLIYRLRGGELKIVNEIHGSGSYVSSCLGASLNEIDVGELGAAAAGDRYLIASDGIETLGETDIGRLLAEAGSARAAVVSLLRAVSGAGHPYQDNTTLIAVFA